MIRRLAKLAIASLVHGTRSETWIGGTRRRRQIPFIVTYHRVVPDGQPLTPTSHPAMLLTTRTLERHVEWLARRFELVSLDDVADRFGGRPGKRPAAAITFDDGYQDVCDNALPLLRRKGIPAAVFVVTDRVGTRTLHLHDRLFLILSRLFADWPEGRGRLATVLHGLAVDRACIEHTLAHGRRPGLAAEALLYGLDRATVERVASAIEDDFDEPIVSGAEHALADWGTLREAAAAGFTIGSHGCSHALLGNEEPRTVVHEVLGSRLEIERHLGTPVRHIAYPSGSFDAVAVRIVAAAGYRCGYTICRHQDPQFPELTIPRHVFWENTCRTVGGDFSGAMMSCHVHDVLGFRPSCPGHRRPASAGGRAYPTEPAAARPQLARSEPYS